VLQSTVFSSLLDDAFQQRWPRPCGTGCAGRRVLWYDFTVDNPRNRDVRGVPLARCGSCSRRGATGGSTRHRRVTLAPPLARAAAAACTRRCTGAWNLLPLLRTHILAWIGKPGRPGCTPSATATGGRWRTSDEPDDTAPVPALSPCPRSATKRSPRWSTRCSSGWVTTGPKAKRFEQRLHRLPGRPGACSTASPSTRPPPACTWRWKALGIGPGDEVITTTHTFTATAEVVRYLGADVKLVDITRPR
jgi:hypothetical protein